jgi:predicted nucleotidyltransferase
VAALPIRGVGAEFVCLPLCGLAMIHRVTEIQILSGPPRYALDQVRQVVARACAREGADRAILFGSYARGTADSASDLDLILIWPTALPFLDRHRAFIDILDAFPGTDLLVYTPAEFEDLLQRSGFIEQAVRAGVVLYDGGGAT